MTGRKADQGVSAIERRIAEAQLALADLGLPAAQQNRLSALALLALLDLRPNQEGAAARNPMRGVHAIMGFGNTHYGTNWAENTRETFRKDAIHYFEMARLIAKNPDNPDRPTNSPHTVYQVTDTALQLLRSFGTASRAGELPAYLEVVGSLADRHAVRRSLAKVPLKRLTGAAVNLSAGAHSDLIEQIISAFAPRFTPGGTLVSVGDTAKKWGYFDEATLSALGVVIGSAGTKMPDVVIYHDEKQWLVIVEAFTNVGPIDALRKEQLEHLFAPLQGRLVFVTAFADRATMARQAMSLAWETDVWIAEAPDHLIHYDGGRFLGPRGVDAPSEV